MQLLCRILLTSLIILDVVRETVNHGKKVEREYNAATSLIAALITLGLLLGGRFYS